VKARKHYVDHIATWILAALLAISAVAMGSCHNAGGSVADAGSSAGTAENQVPNEIEDVATPAVDATEDAPAVEETETGYPARPDGLTEVYVIRAVDGDTLEVMLQNGTTEKVRLIGIDTPESVHPDASKNVPYGEVASAFTSSCLENQDVLLEFDVEERDYYGRLLAYVWLGDELFNDTLVREGHASVDTFPPNVKYVELFTAAQTEARDAGRGMWADEWFGEEAPEHAEEFSLIDGAISWENASSYIGQFVTISGPVKSTKYASSSNGSPTFLNIGADYPDPSRVTALIWGEDRNLFPDAPESMYAGKMICVTGKVELYSGACEIIVSEPAQIEIVY